MRVSYLCTMPKEIERKFLVDKPRWEQVTKPEGEPVRQGYLHADADKAIRVRMKGNKGYLTLKGKTTGATRSEFEYEIPAADATELLDTMAVSELSKIRYVLTFEGKTWEVDEFLGANQGLVVAEIELRHEDESFAVPPWAGKEVTHDARYYNAHLAEKPFTVW